MALGGAFGESVVDRRIILFSLISYQPNILIIRIMCMYKVLIYICGAIL